MSIPAQLENTRSLKILICLAVLWGGLLSASGVDARAPGPAAGKWTASIDIQTATDGHDADEPPGLEIPMGHGVEWTYRVTNTGDARLVRVTVSDDQGALVSCPKAELMARESMTCTAYGIAVDGLYGTVGRVRAERPRGGSVSDSDPSYYFGEHYIPQPPAITIETAVDGAAADTAPGVSIPAGSPLLLTYRLTNTGGPQLSAVVVTDGKGIAVSCPASVLEPGQSMTCSGAGIAEAGQQVHVGSAVGRSPEGEPAFASDAAYYLGVD